jgi:hypothetical protein
MRFFYFLLSITVRYAMPLYFKHRKTINSPKHFFGRTIYVSNHAASFMDPLVIAGYRRPIVFFMTRSDVFKSWLKPILWASHMLPIYRQHDGEDVKKKNEQVFKACTRVLSHGRNLLIFGEGFTDDVFIRRLKPLKKGAARIGFTALNKLNWKKRIYLSAVGCNYSDPNVFRSDMLIATSDKLCLNDYQSLYEESPNKAIHAVTVRLEKMLKEQITHVENKNWAPFHEYIMTLTRKGMNAFNYDGTLSLEDRWNYSRQLAHWMNEHDLENNAQIVALKEDLEHYFDNIKERKLKEERVFDFTDSKNGHRWKELLFMTTMWPIFIIGFLHCFIPYFLVKRFVEKSFKRKVFWGSVKLLMGKIVLGLFSIPFIFLFHNYIYPDYYVSILYYLAIPYFGLVAYKYVMSYKVAKEKLRMSKLDMETLIESRKKLIDRVKNVIPVA